MKSTQSKAKEKEEEELFKELYLTYNAEITVLASRYVDLAVAEDLAQELFLKVWNQKIFLLIDAKELRYYLLTSIRNACLNMLKHEYIEQNYSDNYKKQLIIEELSSEMPPDLMDDDSNILNRIFAEIEKLPYKCREIFIEAYINGKKASEIAQEQSLSRRTVEAQLYKALKLLRKALTIIFF